MFFLRIATLTFTFTLTACLDIRGTDVEPTFIGIGCTKLIPNSEGCSYMTLSGCACVDSNPGGSQIATLQLSDCGFVPPDFLVEDEENLPDALSKPYFQL